MPRRAQPLTQAMVDKLTPVRRTFRGDPAVRGLSIDLVPPRTLTYVFRYVEDGRQKNVRIGCARAMKLSEARAKALEMRRSLDVGAPVKPDPQPRQTVTTYSRYVEERYLPYIKWAHRGHVPETSYIERYLLPSFGALPILEIRRSHLLNWMEELRLKGLKPGSINRVLNIMKASLSKAVEWEIDGLTSSPAKGVKSIPDYTRKERFLTPEEGQRLIEAVQQSANPMLYPLVGFLLLTGARKSEALRMKWADIDFGLRLWTVPLSKSGRPRHIPMSHGAISLVETAKTIAVKNGVGTSEFVFPNLTTGKPLSDVTHAWQKARQVAGLQDVRLHDLRHSYASALVNQGRSIYEVQKLLGHANVRTTERYAHLSTETLMAGASSVERHYDLKYRSAPDTIRITQMPSP